MTCLKCFNSDERNSQRIVHFALDRHIIQHHSFCRMRCSASSIVQVLRYNVTYPTHVDAAKALLDGMREWELVQIASWKNNVL